MVTVAAMANYGALKLQAESEIAYWGNKRIWVFLSVLVASCLSAGLRPTVGRPRASPCTSPQGCPVTQPASQRSSGFPPPWSPHPVLLSLWGNYRCAPPPSMSFLILHQSSVMTVMVRLRLPLGTPMSLGIRLAASPSRLTPGQRLGPQYLSPGSPALSHCPSQCFLEPSLLRLQAEEGERKDFLVSFSVWFSDFCSAVLLCLALFIGIKAETSCVCLWIIHFHETCRFF